MEMKNKSKKETKDDHKKKRVLEPAFAYRYSYVSIDTTHMFSACCNATPSYDAV